MKGKLQSLPEEMQALTLNLSYYTEVGAFQKVRKQLLEHVTGCKVRGMQLHPVSFSKRRKGVTSRIPCCLHGALPCPQALESPLEKKTANNYGPPGAAKLCPG